MSHLTFKIGLNSRFRKDDRNNLQLQNCGRVAEDSDQVK